MQQLSLKLCFFYCQYQVLIYYSFEFLWLPGLYVSWSNGQYCLIDMSSFSPSMVTAQQWNFLIVNIPVVTCNVSWTSIRIWMGNIYSTTQFILLQKIFCCFWFFHCCLHHSFCIIFNVVLCSVLGQFVSSNMMYCTDWSDIACLVL